ncbi:MAG: magnesium transporter [Actinomycetota bacterium]
MTPREQLALEDVTASLERSFDEKDLTTANATLATLTAEETVDVLERLGLKDRAVLYRLLPKAKALEVFEDLDPALQGDLVHGLQDEEVAQVFAGLDPDDRVSLLDELPASVANRLLRSLPYAERDLTAVVLGYPTGSIGRRMNPEYVVVRQSFTAGATLARIRERLEEAETIYTLPVVDERRRLVGVVSLREILAADPETPIAELMREADSVHATDDAEAAARRCADLKHLALPVVDAEDRLLGVFTVDDALTILEEAETEDHARIGGSEPLRRPYLATPVRSLVRARVIWILALAAGAALTVQVLELFEATLADAVVLSLFIPLIIGIGGNTGNQAATTLTRALALDDVRPRDILTVLAREGWAGISLGVIVGAAAFAVVWLAYDVELAAVIGLTILAICAFAAALGGALPLLAKAIGVDPAVFSNPFITTIVDALGLVLYFLIAKALLGI